MGEEVTYNHMAHPVCGLKRREIGGVLADTLSGKALWGGEAARLPVEVAYSAQNQDALSIDATCIGEKFQRLQRSRAFHGRGGKLTLAIGCLLYTSDAADDLL